jgi:hypothetical protein
MTANGNATHYLHHHYQRAEDGRWVLVWRPISSELRYAPSRPSATEDGDRVTTAARDPIVNGQTRRFGK